MVPVKIHEDDNPPRIIYLDGYDFYIRGYWATSLESLIDPSQRIFYENFFDNPTMWIDAAFAPTLENPLIIQVDPFWWDYIRKLERLLYTRIEARTEDSEWIVLNEYLFIINHNPVANAGVDEIITINPDGSVPISIHLDATSSTDIDSYHPTHPDTGLLNYQWSLEAYPPTIDHLGLLYNRIANIDSIGQPLFLSVGEPIGLDGIGTYRFKVTVNDNDVHEIGKRRGLTGEGISLVNMQIRYPTPELSILAPTTSVSQFSNFEDGVNIQIHYRVGDGVSSLPQYNGIWMLRITLKQSIASPHITPAIPNNTIVFEQTRVDFSVEGYFSWDGIVKGDGAFAGFPAIGAFSIELELLDRTGTSIGVAESRSIETNSIIIDLNRWIIPIDSNYWDTRVVGTFMESGHGGFIGTNGIHGGVDLVAPGAPFVRAAKSGIYSSSIGGANPIRIQHNISEQSVYRHGVNFEAIPQNSLVLQGQKLSDMGDAGAESIHLHFEYLQTLFSTIVLNPLSIIDITDQESPEIDEVFLRSANIHATANKANSSTGILDFGDFIIHCRDRAHPAVNRPLDNGPYLIRVTDAGQNVSLDLVFNFFDPLVDRLGNFYARQGLRDQPTTEPHHYLPYIRWSFNDNYLNSGPVIFNVRVEDIIGNYSIRQIIIGPEVSIENQPDPVSNQVASHNIPFWILIQGNTSGIDLVQDNYHIEIIEVNSGVLFPGWSIDRSRSGNILNGGLSGVQIILTTPVNLGVGNYNVRIRTTSNILRRVGDDVMINIIVQ